MTGLHRSRIIAWSLTAVGLCGVLALLAIDRPYEAIAALPCAAVFGVAMYVTDRDLPARRAVPLRRLVAVVAAFALWLTLSLSFDATSPIVWIVLGFGLAEFLRLRRFSAPHAY